MIWLQGKRRVDCSYRVNPIRSRPDITRIRVNIWFFLSKKQYMRIINSTVSKIIATGIEKSRYLPRTIPRETIIAVFNAGYFDIVLLKICEK